MADSITVEEFSRDPMAFVDQVADRHRSLVITKDGRQIAALVGMQAFRMIERVHAQLDELCGRLGRSIADVPEEEAQRMIDEAVKQARREVADEWRAAGRLP